MILDVVRHMITAGGPAQSIYYTYVPENAPMPYYVLRVIGQQEETHKDVYTQVGPYMRTVPYHQRHRIQIDYWHTDQQSAYEGSMGHVDDRPRDYPYAGVLYDVEIISDIPRSVVRDDVTYHARTVDIYLHQYS